MTVPVLILLATIAVAGAAGLWLKARSGRVTAGSGTTVDVDLEPFDGVTLLQLSTTYCAPCRQASAVLAEFACERPDVRHVELDVTERPELAARLDVREAPTTLAVDAGGRELFRVTGVPRRERLAEALR